MPKIDTQKLSAAEKAIYDAALDEFTKGTGAADAKTLQARVAEMESQLAEWKTFGEWYRKSVEPHWKGFTEYVSKGAKPNGDPATQNQNKSGYLTDEEIRAEFNALKDENKKLREEAVKLVNGKEGQVMQLLGLYDRINSLKASKPGVDAKKVLDYMKENGIADPDKAYNLVYGEEEKESYAKTKIEEAKKAWEEEQNNKMAASLPSGPIPRKIAAPADAKSPRQAVDQAREAVAKKYGANVLLPGGLPNKAAAS